MMTPGIKHLYNLHVIKRRRFSKKIDTIFYLTKKIKNEIILLINATTRQKYMIL